MDRRTHPTSQSALRLSDFYLPKWHLIVPDFREFSSAYVTKPTGSARSRSAIATTAELDSPSARSFAFSPVQSEDGEELHPLGRGVHPFSREASPEGFGRRGSHCISEPLRKPRYAARQICWRTRLDRMSAYRNKRHCPLMADSCLPIAEFARTLNDRCPSSCSRWPPG